MIDLVSCVILLVVVDFSKADDYRIPVGSTPDTTLRGYNVRNSVTTCPRNTTNKLIILLTIFLRRQNLSGTRFRREEFAHFRDWYFSSDISNSKDNLPGIIARMWLNRNKFTNEDEVHNNIIIIILLLQAGFLFDRRSTYFTSVRL